MRSITVILFIHAALWSNVLQAAISFTYDNSTGDYSVSGTDDGPGALGPGFIAYRWQFADSDIATDVTALINALAGVGALSGTAAGTPFSSSGTSPTGDQTGFLMAASSTGPLVFNNASGAIGPGVWTGAADIYTGSATASTTDAFTVTITSVPEPATYAALLAGAALGLTALRRRLCA